VSLKAVGTVDNCKIVSKN